jgi:zinc transport system ATP-binding protein
MSLIETKDMSVRYGGAPVLNHVDFTISKGEIVTIVGPNGSGKSTLIRALLGVLKPTRGRVERAAGLRIGYVPQKLAIDMSLPMTVARFLSLPHRSPEAEIRSAAERVGIEGLEHRQMTALSGGQFQRVLLARALLAKPDILILDEPTQGLDHPGVESFYRLIEEVRRDTGAAVLLVSHDLHVVMRASDRVICLNGHVCCEGSPAVVSEAPEYLALFGDGTGGALALYRHDHDHDHDHLHDVAHDHDHDHDHAQDEPGAEAHVHGDHGGRVH